MKKFFGVRTAKVSSSWNIELMNDLRASVHKEEVTETQPRYNIHGKELKNIHRVALMGNIWKMEQLLLRGKNVNKRDKRKRTPLHLACTIGHADMVDFLVERKCKLDLYDGDCRTPLMKAVQYQEEACVTTLLEYGANPHLTDKFGNTALHYAVAGENTSIVEKLLLYHANIEARNKLEFTPFLLAVTENNHKMVELLIRNKADVHVVDKFKRTALMLAAPSTSPDIVRLLLQQGVNTSSRDECGWTAGDYNVFSGFDGNHQITAKHTEERLKNFSQTNNPVVNKTSEEDFIISISIKPGDDASWPASGDEDLSLNTKNTSKSNLRKHYKNSKLGLISPGDKTLFENDNSENKCKHTVGVPSKPSVDVCDSSPPALPSPDPILKPPFTLLGLGLIKEGEEWPVIGTKDDGITESVPQAQRVNDCLTSAYRADKNDRYALGFTEQSEDSSWDSESNSESLPETYVVHLPGNENQKGASKLKEQVEDFSAELDLKMATEKEEESFNESENKHLQIEETKRHQNDETAVLESIYASAAAGLMHPKGSGKTDNNLCPITENEESDGGPAFEIKERRTKDNSTQTSKESVITSRFEKATSLTSRPLQMNNDSTSRGTDHDEESGPAFKIKERRTKDNGTQTSKESVITSRFEKATSLTSRPLQMNNDSTTRGTDHDEESGPAFKIKERRTKDNGTQTSKESVITSRFEKATSLTSRPLQMNNDSTSRGTDHDEERSSKETSSDKEEVKKQIDSMDDFDDLTLSSETIWMDFHMAYSNHMARMLLIEQHGMDCKDSVSSLKIQNEVLSYERLIELKKYHCEQLKTKNKKMENMAKGLQKELSETKEMISKLELQKVEWEHELCSLRYTLEQEKHKRINAEILYEKIKEQLTKREEQYKKEVEMKQELEFNLRALDMELTTVKNNFNQVSVRQLQEELTDTIKKLSMSEASLEVKSRCCTNLEDEVKDLKGKLAQSRNQVDDLTAKLKTVSSRNQVLIQELSSMKEIQKKYEKLEKNKKKLEQQVVNLRSCLEVNMIEYSKIEQYKWDFEETRLNVAEKLKEVDLFLETQVAFQESVAQVRENNYASVRSQLELRIKELEFELSKMKDSQDFSKKELDRYKHLYLEEVTHRMSLSNELNKTSEANMRPAPDLPYGRNVNNNSSLFNRNVAPRENMVIPTSNSRRSCNDIDTYITKVHQELEETITRAAKEAAAEFESGLSGEATYLESTFERHTGCDDVMKAYREYSEFLKQKYSI